MNYYTLDSDNYPVGPVSMGEYYRWHDKQPKHMQTRIGLQVASTAIGDINVSTVFLGMDHRFKETEPVLWETMIFGGEHDQHAMRYTSHEEAEKGHDTICRQAVDNCIDLEAI